MQRALRHISLSVLTVGALSHFADSSHADAPFKDAEEIHGIYLRMTAALNALEVDKFVAEFTDDGSASTWGTKGEEILSKKGVTAAVNALAGNRQKGEFASQPLRLYLDGGKAWATFGWTWGPEWKGNAIGQIQKEAAGWRVRSVDFYSARLANPVVQFNPVEAVTKMTELLTVLQPAATAIAQGDFGAVAAAGHSGFRFVDSKNVPYFGAEGLAAMAQEPAVRSIHPDKMTLFLNVKSSHAMVTQDADGKRISGLLKVENGVWKIHTVSMSPLDTLPVTAKSRTATTWARLRRG